MVLKHSRIQWMGYSRMNVTELIFLSVRSRLSTLELISISNLIWLNWLNYYLSCKVLFSSLFYWLYHGHLLFKFLKSINNHKDFWTLQRNSTCYDILFIRIPSFRAWKLISLWKNGYYSLFIKIVTKIYENCENFKCFSSQKFPLDNCSY